MSTPFDFDCTATDVYPAYASPQMDFDIAIPVKCLLMDQNIGLVRPIEEKALRERRTVSAPVSALVELVQTRYVIAFGFLVLAFGLIFSSGSRQRI